MTLSSYTQLTATVLYTMLSVAKSGLSEGEVWVIVAGNRSSDEKTDGETNYKLYGPTACDPKRIEEIEHTKLKETGNAVFKIDKRYSYDVEYGEQIVGQRFIDQRNIHDIEQRRKKGATLVMVLDILMHRGCTKWRNEAVGHMPGATCHSINAHFRMGFRCTSLVTGCCGCTSKNDPAEALNDALEAAFKKQPDLQIGTWGGRWIGPEPKEYKEGYLLKGNWDYVNDCAGPDEDRCCAPLWDGILSCFGCADYSCVIPESPINRWDHHGKWHEIEMELPDEKLAEIRAKYEKKKAESDPPGYERFLIYEHIGGSKKPILRVIFDRKLKGILSDSELEPSTTIELKSLWEAAAELHK